MSKKLLSKRPKSLKRFIKQRRNLRQLWNLPKARLKLLQKLIRLELLKHNNYLFIEKKVKLQRKMPHQSIKLRDQILVETKSTKEDLILLGVLMMNKIKIIINVSLKKENQLKTMNKMIIKNVVDKHHKNKKEMMKNKII